MAFRWRLRLLAAWLALFGQAATAFGLPMPTLFARRAAIATCGCSSADRASGRCCCARSGLPAGCCQVVPQEASPPKSCCAAKAVKKPSCCQTPQPPKEEKRPSESTPTEADGATMVGGVLSHRCRGDGESRLANPAFASIPPALPVQFVPDATLCVCLTDRGESPRRLANLPSVPPPRSPII